MTKLFFKNNLFFSLCQSIVAHSFIGDSVEIMYKTYICTEFTLTKKSSNQFSISLVEMLLWRNLCQKRAWVNFRNFHCYCDDFFNSHLNFFFVKWILQGNFKVCSHFLYLTKHPTFLSKNLGLKIWKHKLIVLILNWFDRKFVKLL